MKTFGGTIVSVKMQNTVVVEVTRRTPHPMYKKLLTKSRRFKADTNEKDVKLGDKVRIVEVRPIASGKNFKIKEVLV